MPRPAKISPALAARLVAMYDDPNDPATQLQLVDFCATRGVDVTTRTIRTILSQAGVRRHFDSCDCPELRLRIAALFFQEALPDNIIWQELKEEGWQIALRTFIRIRRRMGIKRRLSLMEYEVREQEYLAIIERELDGGEINNYGRTMLYTHFRTEESLQMVISRLVVLVTIQRFAN